MWMLEHDLDGNGRPEMSVIHLESILRGAHLIGIAGSQMIPPELSYHDSHFQVVLRKQIHRLPSTRNYILVAVVDVE
ncbi:hypothetical protein F5887DRAFT_882145 [Amanita rubescens]|nr:hypothetical protein F5887DRAFT_899993 [Amanita rubescens]KAF8347303.1 hypothetical protein F5887DRAFT_882145 [Amanita rubescens]